MVSRVDRIVSALGSTLPTDRRLVIAIAGPPGAGKSTLAAELVQYMPWPAATLQMDGFHFDDAVLKAQGERHRKGAPHTFDVVAFHHLLTLLRDQPLVEVSVPQFDRDLELSRNCAAVVRPEHRVIVTEGNWLLLQTAPWNVLAEVLDLTVWIDAADEELEQRLTQRWLGLGFTQAEAHAKVVGNDLVNIATARSDSRPADLFVS